MLVPRPLHWVAAASAPLVGEGMVLWVCLEEGVGEEGRVATGKVLGQGARRGSDAQTSRRGMESVGVCLSWPWVSGEGLPASSLWDVCVAGGCMQGPE